VPAQDGVGRDEEHRPASAGQHPTQRRKDRPIGGPERGSPHLTAKDSELVAQHRDLDVLGVLAA